VRKGARGMLSLNIQNDVICFEDIKPEQLPTVLEWYNKTDEYKYATGVEQPLTLELLTQKYMETVNCSEEFFVGIYVKMAGIMAGMLKGKLENKNTDVLWISMLMIRPDCRNRGYGSMSITLLMDYFKKKYDLLNIYLTVAEENSKGKMFWIKQGFGEIKRVNNYKSWEGRYFDVAVMHKNLVSCIK